MELGDEFTTTATGARFLLYDSRQAEPDKKVILIFASDRGLDLLRRYPKNVRRVSLIECCLLNLIGEIFKIVVRLILLLFYLLCLLTENGQIKMRMIKKGGKVFI
jgi:hypothetical protein